MADFLFIYRGGHDMSQISPEEMQQLMGRWMEWMEGGTKAGWLLEGGDALTPEGRVVRPDGGVTDGPYAESKELVGGYSIVKASGYDEAVRLAKTCPHHSSADLKCSGDIEIRELAKAGQEPAS